MTGDEFKFIRRKAGLYQKEVAQRIKVHATTLIKYERSDMIPDRYVWELQQMIPAEYWNESRALYKRKQRMNEIRAEIYEDEGRIAPLHVVTRIYNERYEQTPARRKKKTVQPPEEGKNDQLEGAEQW